MPIDKARSLSQNCLRYKAFKNFELVDIKVMPHQLRYSFVTDLINKGAKSWMYPDY